MGNILGKDPQEVIVAGRRGPLRDTGTEAGAEERPTAVASVGAATILCMVRPGHIVSCVYILSGRLGKARSSRGEANDTRWEDWEGRSAEERPTAGGSGAGGSADSLESCQFEE